MLICGVVLLSGIGFLGFVQCVQPVNCATIMSGVPWKNQGWWAPKQAQVSYWVSIVKLVLIFISSLHIYFAVILQILHISASFQCLFFLYLIFYIFLCLIIFSWHLKKSCCRNKKQLTQGINKGTVILILIIHLVLQRWQVYYFLVCSCVIMFFSKKRKGHGSKRLKKKKPWISWLIKKIIPMFYIYLCRVALNYPLFSEPRRLIK